MQWLTEKEINGWQSNTQKRKFEQQNQEMIKIWINNFTDIKVHTEDGSDISKRGIADKE
jgi:disulfide oxidoreductase YuzD